MKAEQAARADQLAGGWERARVAGALASAGLAERADRAAAVITDPEHHTV